MMMKMMKMMTVKRRNIIRKNMKMLSHSQYFKITKANYLVHEIKIRQAIKLK